MRIFGNLSNGGTWESVSLQESDEASWNGWVSAETLGVLGAFIVMLLAATQN